MEQIFVENLRNRYHLKKCNNSVQYVTYLFLFNVFFIYLVIVMNIIENFSILKAFK